MHILLCTKPLYNQTLSLESTTRSISRTYMPIRPQQFFQCMWLLLGQVWKPQELSEKPDHVFLPNQDDRIQLHVPLYQTCNHITNFFKFSGKHKVVNNYNFKEQKNQSNRQKSCSYICITFTVLYISSNPEVITQLKFSVGFDAPKSIGNKKEAFGSIKNVILTINIANTKFPKSSLPFYSLQHSQLGFQSLKTKTQ